MVGQCAKNLPIILPKPSRYPIPGVPLHRLLGLPSPRQRNMRPQTRRGLRPQKHRQPGSTFRHQFPGSTPVRGAGAQGAGYHDSGALRVRRRPGGFQEARPRSSGGLAFARQDSQVEEQTSAGDGEGRGQREYDVRVERQGTGV